MGKSRPDALDRALGWRIREVRLGHDMSQATLAKCLALTFQQVQKYESGVNRVSFSRLVQIADAFEMTVQDLIEPLAPGRVGLDGRMGAKELARSRKPYLERRINA